MQRCADVPLTSSRNVAVGKNFHSQFAEFTFERFFAVTVAIAVASRWLTIHRGHGCGSRSTPLPALSRVAVWITA